MDDREAFRRTQEEASKKFKAKKAKRNAVKRLALSNLSYKHKKNGTKEAERAKLTEEEDGEE